MQIINREVPSIEKFEITLKEGVYTTDIDLKIGDSRLSILWDVIQFEEFITLLKEHIEEKMDDLAYEMVGNSLYSRRD